MYDVEPMANAYDFVSIESTQKCCVCKSYREIAKLYCGHKVPLTVTEGIAVKGVAGKLKLVPGFINKYKISMLIDSGLTLIGVEKDLVCPKDCAGEHTICDTFGGSQERYALAWVRIRSPYLYT